MEKIPVYKYNSAQQQKMYKVQIYRIATYKLKLHRQGNSCNLQKLS